ncbi:RHS repeat domain-containing protein [Cysteiniphilum sp. QT6929]|uniref:RHS repeat domain-containing protein n=1 Tax=Cysteiniphilum sp. QT6929 TaxID=2975055 RepID=UPI0024B36DE0|nr:RHS repeat domain-containing protein [Cysteiniphilum sp. QT6929]WHN66541.1 RHS repeat protein [Cysteiniphilum sp. QT6929]
MRLNKKRLPVILFGALFTIAGNTKTADEVKRSEVPEQKIQVESVDMKAADENAVVKKKLSAEGGQNNSNARNYTDPLAINVNPRTGGLSMMLSLIGTQGISSDIALQLGLSYVGGSVKSYGLPAGWQWAMDYIQTDSYGNSALTTTSGGSSLYDAAYESGLRYQQMKVSKLLKKFGTLKAHNQTIDYKWTVYSLSGYKSYFNENGALVATVDRFGNTNAYIYTDGDFTHSKLIKVIDSWGSQYDIIYQPDAVIVSAKDKKTTLSFEYGNLQAVSYRVNDAKSIQTKLEYDAYNHLTSVKYPNGIIKEFVYSREGDATVMPGVSQYRSVITSEKTKNYQGKLVSQLNYKYGVADIISSDQSHNYSGYPDFKSSNGDPLLENHAKAMNYYYEVAIESVVGGELISRTVMRYDSMHRQVDEALYVYKNNKDKILLDKSSAHYPYVAGSLEPKDFPKNYQLPNSNESITCDVIMGKCSGQYQKHNKAEFKYNDYGQKIQSDSYYYDTASEDYHLLTTEQVSYDNPNELGDQQNAYGLVLSSVISDKDQARNLLQSSQGFATANKLTGDHKSIESSIDNNREVNYKYDNYGRVISALYQPLDANGSYELASTYESLGGGKIQTITFRNNHAIGASISDQVMGVVDQQTDIVENKSEVIYDALGRKIEERLSVNPSLNTKKPVLTAVQPYVKTYEYQMISEGGVFVDPQANAQIPANVVIVKDETSGMIIYQYSDEFERNIATGNNYDYLNDTYLDHMTQITQRNYYDDMGRLIYSQDERGLKVYPIYDEFGQKIGQSNPDGSADIGIIDLANNRKVSMHFVSDGVTKTYSSLTHIAGADVPAGSKLQSISVSMNDDKGSKGYSYSLAADADAQHVSLGGDGSLTYKAVYDEALQAELSQLIKTWNKPLEKSTAGYQLQDAQKAAIGFVDNAIKKNAYLSSSYAEYDSWGNVIKAVDNKGVETLYFYDNVRTKDSDGNEHWGRLIKTITQYADDVELTNSDRSKTMEYTYDEMDHLTEVSITADGRTVVLGNRVYDRNGNLTSESSNGVTVIRQYDKAGNVVEKHLQNGTVIFNEYDAKANLIHSKVVLKDGTVESQTSWAFDEKTNDLIAVNHENFVSAGKEDYYKDDLLFEYYNSGQLKAKYFDDNKSISYSYDQYGQVSSVTDIQGSKTEYSYDTLGRVNKIDMKNNAGILLKSITVNYDAQGRIITKDSHDGLIKVMHYNDQAADATLSQRNGALNGMDYLLNGNQLLKLTYTYYDDGNLALKTRQQKEGFASEQYIYDLSNNLQAYTCKGELCPRDQEGHMILSQRYTFDFINNILSEKTETKD